MYLSVTQLGENFHTYHDNWDDDNETDDLVKISVNITKNNWVCI